MNLLLLAPELFTSNGGIPRILRSYLKALCLHGEAVKSRVSFIALNDDTVEDRELRRYTGPTFGRWECCSGNKVRFIRSSLRHSRGIDRIICGHVGQLPVAYAASLMRSRLSYDLVAHGIEVWRSFGVFERVALRRVRKVYCVSHYTRDRLAASGVVRQDKLVVLPNCLDPYFRIADKVSPPAHPPTILTVARLMRDDRYKGIDTLIQAMPQVRAAIPEVRLRIVGKGDDAARLRSLSNSLGLGSAVEMPGFVSDSALERHFVECSLFALPSKKEGFGLVFLEAMSQGRPCLGAKAGGIPDVITPDTGVLVPYGDIPAIAAGLVTALGKTWNNDAILARARHFDFGHFNERLAALL